MSYPNTLQINKFISTSQIALMWMPQNIFDDRSILIQVVAWCRQAASHYLIQCWPLSTLWYGSPGHNELITPVTVIERVCNTENRHLNSIYIFMSYIYIEIIIIKNSLKYPPNSTTCRDIPGQNAQQKQRHPQILMGLQICFTGIWRLN